MVIVFPALAGVIPVRQTLRTDLKDGKISIIEYIASDRKAIRGKMADEWLRNNTMNYNIAYEVVLIK